MSSLYPGRIFWQVFPGPRGGGKPRPMIVVSSGTEIAREGFVRAIVCSTLFTTTSLQPNEIRLPYQDQGRCVTRLKDPTVAVCDWTVRLPIDDVPSPLGCVPTEVLREIFEKAGLAFPP